MLPEIVTLSKSVSLRLDEYQKLLDDSDTPSSDMMELWVSIFEDLTVIGVDWQALWILTEEYCEKYNLLFPTAVNDFIWQELMASVSVLAVQEDIVIPSQLYVPVIDLHPIKNQDYDEAELRNIEDWLDKCRYFMKNLWYPWDAKLNVSIKDWCKNHLENRLLMQNDIKNGVFDPKTVNYLKSLLLEAQNFNYTVSKRYPEHEDEQLTAVKQLLRRKILKTELNLFENPEFRKGMILLKSKNKYWKKISDTEKSLNNEAKFIWMGGNCNLLIKYLNDVQKYFSSNIKLKVYESLQEALDVSLANNIILLPPGVHNITKFKGISEGGLIKGFSKEDTIITPDISSMPRAILFDCFGIIQMENVSIEKSAGITVQVFDGTVQLCDCRLISKKNATSRGIVVMAGCKLFLKNCELSGFGTGIALQKGGEVSLLNTRILDCVEGIKLTENTSLTMESVEISYCSTFAIRMESSKVDLGTPIIGDLDLLKNRITCKFISVTLNCNKKGNVLIRNVDKALVLDDVSIGEISSDVICIDDTDHDESYENMSEKKEKLCSTDKDIDDMRTTFQKSL